MQPLYDEREAAAIAHELLEHITGMSKLQRLSAKNEPLTAAQVEVYEQAVAQAVRGVPLQYITGRAWFMGAEYVVNANVLIPRPETEELVQLIADEAGGDERILDVGTGSGCIPIGLKRLLPQATVTSCDVSEGALDVARQNAARLEADVTLLRVDILDEEQYRRLGVYDRIVSNPPYIPQAERERLHENVREYEPGLALFVPDDDALLFYRVLAGLGRDHLAPGGRMYCELDADHAQETAELFVQMGYVNVRVRKDIHGNERMLVAER